MAATLGREEGKHLPVLSSGLLLGKRRLEGRGMVSKREEVVFLLWGNLLQTAKVHYSVLATEIVLGRQVRWKLDGCEQPSAGWCRGW